jgi:hypothetical protein
VGAGSFRADGHDETYSLFSQFNERALKRARAHLLQGRNFILAVNDLDGREASQLQLGMPTSSLSHCEV